MPKSYFQTCDACGAHLDPGETCDCQFKPTYLNRPIIKSVDDQLIISVDAHADGDTFTVSVGRRVGRGIKLLNTIQGKEAEDLYYKLTGELAEKT